MGAAKPYQAIGQHGWGFGCCVDLLLHIVPHWLDPIVATMDMMMWRCLVRPGQLVWSPMLANARHFTASFTMTTVYEIVYSTASLVAAPAVAPVDPPWHVNQWEWLMKINVWISAIQLASQELPIWQWAITTILRMHTCRRRRIVYFLHRGTSGAPANSGFLVISSFALAVAELM